MKLACPRCHSKIPPDGINVSTDVAKCISCHEVLRVSELVADIEAADHLNPPSGSRIRVVGDPASTLTLEIPRQGLERVTPTNPLQAARSLGAWSRSRGMQGPLPQLTLSYGTKTTSIAEHVSEAEMEWLAGLIRTHVQRSTGKRIG